MKKSLASFGLLTLIVAGAAAFRLSHLDNRPMHTDEAVHGAKYGKVLEGTYKYDPNEFHGPTIYYLTAPIAFLDGADTLAETTEIHLRLAPAICGLLIIAGLWLIRDAIGSVAMLCGAVLTAVSPAMIFYSRYYIQEMFLVCFTFFAIAAFWRCANKQGAWRIVWLVVAGACVGLMHATKETCIIAYFAIAAGGLAVAVISLCEGNGWTKRKIASLSIGGGVVLVAAAAVSAVCFSLMFTKLGGIADSITTYGKYFTRAGGEGSAGVHRYPWDEYLRRIIWWTADGQTVWYEAWTEAFIVALALVGLVAALIGKGCGKASLPFVRFLCVFTVLMTLVYSTLSYKTPWCLLGFLHGMILLAGLGASVLLRIARPVPLKATVAVLLLAGAGNLGYQGWRASFPMCANPTNPYVYAHTTWDVPRLVCMVRGVAELHPDKNNMHVQVLCPDNHYWPFPWYLRDFPRLDIRVQDKDGRILPWAMAPVIIYRPDLSEDFNDILPLRLLEAPPYGWFGPEAKVYKEPWDWELRPNAFLNARVERKLLSQYVNPQAPPAE